MARGDLTLFEEFANYLGGGFTSQTGMDFENGGDTFKLFIVTSAASVAASATTPAYGDWSANEVSGSNYTATGATLASQSFNEASGTATFDAADVTWSQASGGTSGFTGAYKAILYDDTVTSPADPAICFIDLGGPVNNNDGDVTVSWNSSGIFTVAV